MTYILTLFDTSLQQGKSVIRDGHWNIMDTSWADFTLIRQAPSLPVLTITQRPFMVVMLIWMVKCFLWWRPAAVPWSVHRMSLVENWSALFAPGNKNVKKKNFRTIIGMNYRNKKQRTYHFSMFLELHLNLCVLFASTNRNMKSFFERSLVFDYRKYER